VGKYLAATIVDSQAV